MLIQKKYRYLCKAKDAEGARLQKKLLSAPIKFITKWGTAIWNQFMKNIC